MTEIDIYADENEPCAEVYGTVYRVSVPSSRRSQFKTGEIPWIYVTVGSYGMIEQVDGTWFGKLLRKMPYDERREVYEWLSEWELIQLKKIGPEDSEYFATENLTGEDNERYFA